MVDAYKGKFSAETAYSVLFVSGRQQNNNMENKYEGTLASLVKERQCGDESYKRQWRNPQKKGEKVIWKKIW